MTSSYKLAIIGSKEAILGFTMLGVDTFPCQTKEQLLEILFRLKKEKVKEENHEKNVYATIFVTEELAEQIPDDEYKKLINQPLPPCH